MALVWIEPITLWILGLNTNHWIILAALGQLLTHHIYI